MSEEKAIKLIHQYFHEGELNEKELEELLIWLENPEYRQLLDDQIALDYALQTNKDFNATKAYQEIQKYLGEEKEKRYNRAALLKYAAILILVFGLGYYFLSSNSVEPIVSEDSTAVTLKLNEGKVKYLSEKGHEILLNKRGKRIGIRENNTLSYDKNSMARELVYNTLYVPKGKTFRLKLSDGTEILLNADTEIQYPISFLPGQERQIKLKGEAYFQVVKDSLRPFIVGTSRQNVKVYGTTFNIKSYGNDAFEETVLVSGSVGVKTKDTEVKLTPGEMARMGKEEVIKVENVDIEYYTAWIQDQLIFESDRFDEIIKVLERKFNVEIDNTYKELDSERFTARFDHKKALDQILKLFAESRSFEYEREGNHIKIYRLKP